MSAYCAMSVGFKVHPYVIALSSMVEVLYSS